MNDTNTPSRFAAAAARALSLALYAAGLDLAHLAGLLGRPVEELRGLLAGEQSMMAGEFVAACRAIGVRADEVLADAERMAAEPLPGDRVRIVESGDLATVTALHRYGIEVVPDCLDSSLIFQREHLELAVDELSVEYAAVVEEEKSRLEREVRALGDELAGIPVALADGTSGVIAGSDEHGLVIAVSPERQAHDAEQEQAAAVDAAIRDGRGCSECRRLWRVGEASRPAGFGPSGQLFRCAPACGEASL